jgi:choline dehydrogenase
MALGHVFGGGSINAMVLMRGMQRDYYGWAENGAKGWAFADLLPVFKKQALVQLRQGVIGRRG